MPHKNRTREVGKNKRGRRGRCKIREAKENKKEIEKDRETFCKSV